jgi:ATP-dependent DNA helicase RecQ
VPAYVVFHDATLREVAARRPRNSEELAGVKGMGEKKLEVYGQDLLELVAQHEAEPAAPGPVIA